MIANFTPQPSTSTSIIPPDNVVCQHTFVRFVSVGDDVKTAMSPSEYEEITLHVREQEILKKQEEARRKEELAMLEKKKPNPKWYRQFQKHKKQNKFV